MIDVYLCTQEKFQFLRDKGYNVVEMWECQWCKMKEQNNDVKHFVIGLDLVTSLNPCDAFFGGRTNAIKLFHLSSNNKDEQILYYDFTSLYPYVNKNAVYPKTS